MKDKQEEEFCLLRELSIIQDMEIFLLKKKLKINKKLSDLDKQKSI